MFPYIPNTEKETKEILDFLSIKSVDELFSDIPDNLKLNRELKLESSLSELEVEKRLKDLALKNKSMEDMTCFLGAGIYDHYIPSVIKHITGRSEFYTAYTPYQPEVSQGTLQAIFEYQSMICALTGMEVSNSSMYDGATATAEAAILSIVSTKRNTIIVSKSVNPDTRKVLKTYLKYRGYNMIEVDLEDGTTDVDKVINSLDKNVAAVIIQSPNFFGLVEDVENMVDAIHKNKSLLIMNVDPISLGILKSPGELGADIVVGDGQCLGANMSYGGPGLGFMNTTKKLMRKMPGRIVGQTEDVEGKRGFVLTLQAREQHIRREKATSNICSDQTAVAIGAAVYMATLGKEGIREVAKQCAAKSHYAYNELIKSGKYKPVFNKPFFKEFVVKGEASPCEINNKLLENNTLGGYDLGKVYSEYKNSMLLCVTEKRTREDIDNLVKVMEAI
ncbi:aminomethyl-transferring glycine dehydrogenase subunit GcvPA [Clostridium botulinum]|uniref:aminomethyl-transferring glycine dehydrogenase subunit GcvPA n=1 Tax=Clostridium botulinum TaxID=1491 RepID=UPI0004A599F5|nr:aminomethyl-transferring glycine dehydrogenase subunit GcvPA [Clostridium botulinum]KEI98695.1 glycine dehydrogenase [Clostridium botulinum A2B3 87]MBY6798563.1 aminomethyl-transferring glycine dehydrogenase subunit GcvPA [Clostridium botulinum]NFC26925.1 aminomethyl-transferring glycine dehydrogenase subunit GcvPA [Clostridium botulinum]NFC60843.1 aminomethyl-transferring glycine dehydrogenase subunit GcvPA [Clostridium botulinum]NFC69210.1 aminomethyl-transferring glycine dehydrogenase su